VRAGKNGTRCPGGVCCDAGCVPCCAGVGNCVACQTAETCPGQDTVCTTRTCVDGFCGVKVAPAGTVVAAQAPGDCKKRVCGSAGVVVQVNDDTDLPPDDGSQCTTATCSGGTPSHAPVAAGTACNQNGGARCNGRGVCVACLAADDCPGEDTECQRRFCDSGACGFARTAAGTVASAQRAGDCKRIECDGLGGAIEVDDDGDLPDDGDPCTQNLCVAGVPSHPPAVLGTPCGTDLVCDGEGNCNGCASATSCPGEDTECQTRTCLAGVCGMEYAASGTPLSTQTPGDCQKDVCDGAGGVTQVVDDTDVPGDDGNPCTENSCTDGVPYPLLPAGTQCRFVPASVCDATGACVPLKLRGEPCQTAAECSSGFCADGVCCDAACDLLCRACTAVRKGTGEDGVCGSIQDGLDPDDECPGTSACNGAGGCTGCTSAAECPGTDTECQYRTCTGGTCGVAYAASGTAISTQTSADCKTWVCDGAGGVVEVPDDSDVPADDGNDCARVTCSQGSPLTVYRDPGFPCGDAGAVCNGSGVCGGCATAADCPGEDTECRIRTCDAGQCGYDDTPAGTPISSQQPGDCKQIQCDGAGGTVELVDDNDAPPDDGNQCTENACSGGVPYPPKPLGTECNQSLGALCDGKGACIKQALNGAECVLDVQCLSFMCVDGYCCNSACTRACQACDVPGNVGNCVYTPGAHCNENGGTICDSSGQCIA
jgi:hypothetical protein